MIATRRPVALAAARRVSITLAWVAKSPCEKFSRATLIPASSMRSIMSWDSDAGPIVQTIFVLLAGSLMPSSLSLSSASSRRSDQERSDYFRR